MAAMFAESALVHGGVLGVMNVVYHTPWLFKFPPELWRIPSSFLLTGKGFSFVFDLYFSESVPSQSMAFWSNRLSVYICLGPRAHLLPIFPAG